MTDSFEVPVKSADVLRESHLVTDMQEEAEDMGVFPVFINGRINFFNAIEGGYVKDGDYTVVSLIIRKSNSDKIDDAQKPFHIGSHQYEVHLKDTVWVLNVGDRVEYEDETEYRLSLKIVDHMGYPYTFYRDMGFGDRDT